MFTRPRSGLSPNFSPDKRRCARCRGQGRRGRICHSCWQPERTRHTKGARMDWGVNRRHRLRRLPVTAGTGLLGSRGSSRSPPPPPPATETLPPRLLQAPPACISSPGLQGSPHDSEHSKSPPECFIQVTADRGGSSSDLRRRGAAVREDSVLTFTGAAWH